MRYIRQEILEDIGKRGQEKLGRSTVAIIGIGALGTVSSQLLARAGIGKLVLVDRDVVEPSNLQRQNLFEEKDIGKTKASQADRRLRKINSSIKINFFVEDMNFENIEKILNQKTDLILDCTDNLETRFLINDFSIKNKIPFIYSSALGGKGYIFNVVPKKTPCLRCFLPEAKHLETCETSGVLNTITNLVSSVQANEAIKILLGKNYEKALLFFDIRKNELMKIKANKNENCACCSKNNFEYLNGKKSSRIAKLCGDNIFRIKNKSMSKQQFTNLKNKLKKVGSVNDFQYFIDFNNKISIFSDGSALVKAKSAKEAKSLYTRFIGN